jgi:YD repeat-containing protein
VHGSPNNKKEQGEALMVVIIRGFNRYSLSTDARDKAHTPALLNPSLRKKTPTPGYLLVVFLVLICLLAPYTLAHGAVITDCKVEGGTYDCIGPIPEPFTYLNNAGTCPGQAPPPSRYLTEEEDIAGAVAVNMCAWNGCSETHTVGQTWVTDSYFLGIISGQSKAGGVQINTIYATTQNPQNPPCTYSRTDAFGIGRSRGASCPKGYNPSTGDSATGKDGFCYRVNNEPKACPDGECTDRANPVSVVSGKKMHQEQDYQGNGSFPLAFERQYASFGFSSAPPGMEPLVTGMGRFWRHQYERFVGFYKSTTKTTATVFRPNGAIEYFYLANGAWVGRDEQSASLAGGLDVNGNPTGWTYTNRDGVVETYNANGLLVQLTDRAGRSQVLGYDNAGRLASVTDAFGHSLTFAYSSTGLLASMTDPSGQSVIYGYDGHNNLISVDYPDGSSKLYHYENTALKNHLTGISYRDSAGTVTRYSTYGYDSYGLATSSQHAGGMEKHTFNYSQSAYTVYGTEVIDAAGKSMSYEGV